MHGVDTILLVLKISSVSQTRVMTLLRNIYKKMVYIVHTGNEDHHSDIFHPGSKDTVA